MYFSEFQSTVSHFELIPVFSQFTFNELLKIFKILYTLLLGTEGFGVKHFFADSSKNVKLINNKV